MAIARALITNPRLILADEPTGSLDPITSREVLELFKRLHREQSVSFLLVTHSSEVANFCDRALELRDGRFIAQHGEGFEVDELSDSRELLIDDMGMVSLPPDLLLQMGGPGRWVVDEVKDRRLILQSAEEEIESEYAKRVRTLVSICPACKHVYKNQTMQMCPDCGASRPLE